MICASCERRQHYNCIDCKNDHRTYLCSCDCHDENTLPHGEQERHGQPTADPARGGQVRGGH